MSKIWDPSDYNHARDAIADSNLKAAGRLLSSTAVQHWKEHNRSNIVEQVVTSNAHLERWVLFLVKDCRDPCLSAKALWTETMKGLTDGFSQIGIELQSVRHSTAVANRIWQATGCVDFWCSMPKVKKWPLSQPYNPEQWALEQTYCLDLQAGIVLSQNDLCHISKEHTHAVFESTMRRKGQILYQSFLASQLLGGEKRKDLIVCEPLGEEQQLWAWEALSRIVLDLLAKRSAQAQKFLAANFALRRASFLALENVATGKYRSEIEMSHAICILSQLAPYWQNTPDLPSKELLKLIEDDPVALRSVTSAITALYYNKKSDILLREAAEQLLA